jgi:hypothetical protein
MFGFLGNLGSGLARAFMGGAKSIGSGVKRLGQLGPGEDDEDLGPGGTPPFAPSNTGAQSGPGIRGLEDAVASAEDNARRDYETRPMPMLAGDLPDLPTSRASLSIPAAAIPTPSAAPSFSGLNRPPATLPDLSPVRSVTLAPAAAPESLSLSTPTSGIDLDRRNVAIPSLPGHAGGPTPYNSIDAAKYDAIMSHAKRDAEGNLLGKDQGGGFNRDWKTIAQNLLLSASQAAAANPRDPLGAALGGALVGGAGSAINPEKGYEFNFDVGQRPKLEAEQERQRRERDQAIGDILKQAQIDQIPTQAEHGRLQNEQMRSQIEVSRENAQRQKALTQSQIDLNKARAEAARTGKPQVRDVADENGDVYTYQINADGSMNYLGNSAKATINAANNTSRENISDKRNQTSLQRTGMQQGGANARSAASIDAAKDRTQMRIDAADKRQANRGGGSKLAHPSNAPQTSQGSGATVSSEQIRKSAKTAGISEQEGRKRAIAAGYTIKD